MAAVAFGSDGRTGAEAGTLGVRPENLKLCAPEQALVTGRARGASGRDNDPLPRRRGGSADPGQIRENPCFTKGDRLSLTANAADLQAFDTAGTALQRLAA
jgi:hypothetical protein